jgi:hypothetical protein
MNLPEIERNANRSRLVISGTGSTQPREYN